MHTILWLLAVLHLAVVFERSDRADKQCVLYPVITNLLCDTGFLVPIRFCCFQSILEMLTN